MNYQSRGISDQAIQGPSSYKAEITAAEALLKDHPAWNGVTAEAVARMRLQNRFRTGLDVARYTADVMRADMAAYDADPTKYTQSLGCWHGFIAQQKLISIKKHFGGKTDRRYLYLSGWMIAALRSEFGPLPDQSMHEKTSVPALIEELYTFLRQADSRELNDIFRALDAAREAGELLLGGYRSRPAIELKSRANLVTRYDRDSEALLGERLRATGLPVFGEELGGDTGAATFYVDPLDGTTNFAHGHPFFCVSIGLVEAGRPLLGVVLAPALGLEWRGAPGIVHSTRNGERCAPSAVARLEDAMIATGFPSVREDRDFEAFLASKRVVQAVRRCGAGRSAMLWAESSSRQCR